jgi:DNA polymerase I-like protein with 3'-5' exonuclease and polymerase domains
MPTGRIYKFEPIIIRGSAKWPRTQILNYPVQGTGHDIVTIARVSLWKRIRADEALREVKFISTVHDSIVLDMPSSDSLLERVCNITHGVFNDIPANFNKLFGATLNLPIQCEISVGNNLLDTKVV